MSALAEVHGNVTIQDGVATLPDGTQIDLQQPCFYVCDDCGSREVVFTTSVFYPESGNGEVDASNEWYDPYCNNCEELEGSGEHARVTFKEGNLLFKGKWYSVS